MKNFTQKLIGLLALVFTMSFTVNAQDNYSLSFDGVDDYIDFGNTVGNLSNATIQFWIKTSENTGYNLLLNKDCDGCESSSGDWGFITSNGEMGRIDFSINNQSGFTYVTGVQINDNAWHFISVTRDESTGLIEFFVDGELVNSEIGATGLVSNNNNLQFGLQQIYNPAFYQGELENLQIFNRILSEDEIQSYLTCAPTGEEDGLVGYWNFNEGSGNTADDISGSGNQGAINGAQYSEDVPEQDCENIIDPIITLEGHTYIGELENSIYYISNDISTWEEANEIAANLGGHLVTISSEEENQFIWNAVYNQGYNPGGTNNYQAWIGLYQNTESNSYQEPDGGWQWVNGEEFSYSNWASHEPDNSDGGYFAHISDSNCPLNGGSEDNQCGTWCDDPISSNLTSAFHIIEYKYGCTDSEASNYDETVSLDDGSCQYSEEVSYEEEVQGHSYLGTFEGSTYYLSNEVVNWYEADSISNSLGGHIVSITSEEEDNFLKSVLTPDESYFIGLFQNHNIEDTSEPSGNWQWVTGEPFVYQNWQDGEPNDITDGEDFGSIAGWSQAWNDAHSGSIIGHGTMMNYILEIDPSESEEVSNELEDQDYSLIFDGVDDYVIVDNPIYSAEEFSLNCWVKFSQVGPNENGNLIANWSMDPGGSYILYYSSYQGNQTISAIVGGDEETVYLETPLQSGDFNTWNFISLTYDGTHSKLYINGDLRDSLYGEFGTIEGSNIATFGVEENYNFGQGINAHYGGVMDEISIWNKSLSNQEIQSYMSCPPTGHEESLVGYWKINEISSNIIYDASVNENHGIIYGGATLSEDVPEQNCNESIEDSDDNIDEESNVHHIDGLLYVGSFSGSNYYFTPVEMEWEEASLLAIESGGNLTVINSHDEFNYIVNNFSSFFTPSILTNGAQSGAWIGLEDYNWQNDETGLESNYCSHYELGLPSGNNFGMLSIDNASLDNGPCIANESDSWFNVVGLIEVHQNVEEEDELNYSMSFDGIDDYVEIQNNSGFDLSESFTIILFTKVNDDMQPCNGMTFIGENNPPSNNQVFFFGYNGCHSACQNGYCVGLDFYETLPNVALYASSYVSDDWISWVATYNSETARRKIYADGVLIGDSIMGNVYQGNSNLILGATYDYFDVSFNGKMDNLIILDDDMEFNEILSHVMCPSDINDDGIIGYWNFNEGSGDTLYDISGNSNHGLINGASFSEDVPEQNCDVNTDVETVDEEQQNYSMSFDGVDDFIDIGLPNGFDPSGSHTFMFYEKHFSTDECNSLGMIISEYGYAQTSQGLHYGYRACEANCPFGSCFGVDFYNNNIYTESINDLTWKHWAISYNHLTYERSIYLNGDLVANDFSNNIAYAGPFDLIFGATQFLDSNPSIMGNYFSGQLDEITLWNKELSIEEVQSNITCPIIDNQEALVGYWNFNEGSGDTVYDISGNNNDGLINGATYIEDVPENNCNESDDDINNSLYEIGDFAEGGIVFYAEEGEQGKYGLIAALEDLDEIYQWGCYNQEVDGADGEFIGMGYQNTLDIVAGCSETPIAASQALAYESEGYSDWYLPSIDELKEMYDMIGQGASIGNVGNFFPDWYSSSSENANNTALGVYFNTSESYGVNRTHPSNVRLIRAFGNWTMGCMDETACNYNAEANMGDGSCTYAEQVYDCDGNLTAEIEEPICGYLPTGIDIWPYVDITIPDGYKVQSVYADFDRPGYYGAQLDFSIAYCSNCDLFPVFTDNLTDFLIWNYDTIPYSLYDTELVISEVSEIELNGPGTIRVLAPLPYDGWNNFCVTFRQLIYGCMDSLACNYNSDVNMADGSCEYSELGYDCDGNWIMGCMDETACNYNPDAILSDDSCILLDNKLYYCESFEGSVDSEWTSVNTMNYYGSKLLGNFSNESLGFLISNVPIHDSIEISFDLYILDSWDGNNALGDLWTFKVSDSILLSSTFSNYPIFDQSYPGQLEIDAFPPQTGAHTTNLPNYSWNWDDCCGDSVSSMYKMNFSLEHSLEDINIEMFANNLEQIIDESWAIDNFTISIISQGCTNPTAFNFDLNANTDDGSCLTYEEFLIDSLQQALAVFETDIDLSEENLSIANNSIDVLAFDLGLANDNIASLESDIDLSEESLSIAVDSISVLTSDLELANDSIISLETDLELSEESLSIANDSIDVLTSDLGLANDSITSLAFEISVIQSDISLLESQLDSTINQLTQIQLDLEASINDINILSDSIVSLNEFITSLQEELSIAMSNQEDGISQADVDAAYNEGAILGEEYGYSQGYNDGYNQGNEEGESYGYTNGFEEGVASVTPEDGISQLDVDAVQILLDEANSTISNLNSSLNTTNSTIAELEEELLVAMSNQEDGISQLDVDAVQILLDEANNLTFELNNSLALANLNITELEVQLSACLENQTQVISIDLIEGWNIIGYTLYEPQDAAASFVDITNELQLVKNNSADVYWPEFAFNGIGDLIPGQGYQVRVTSNILNFTFPNVDGQRIELVPTVPQWVIDMEVDIHPNDIRTLVKVVNMLGQEVNPVNQPNGTVLLFLYNDGTVEKKIK